jgi:hypothetical protein
MDTKVPGSSPRQSSRQRRHSAPGARLEANWLLSFGDLLTLVLCFFLALIGTGTLTLAPQSGSAPSHAQGLANLQTPPDSAPGSNRHGTPLAFDKVRSRLADTSLLISLESEWRTRVAALIEEVRPFRFSVTVESCGTGSDAWTEALENGLEIASFVERHGVEVRNRVFGARCDLLRAQEHGTAVVRIRVGD